MRGLEPRYAMPTLAVGSFVVHRNLPERGPGKVVCVSDKYARVVFIDDRGARNDMRVEKSFVEPVETPDDLSRFAGLEVVSTSDCKPVSAPGKSSKGKAGRPPGPPEWTLAQAVERFLTHYPEGFAGDQYLQAEREWKVAKGARWAELFAEQDLRAATQQDPQAAGAKVMEVVQTKAKDAALLSPVAELPRLSWALQQGAPAPFLQALADTLESAQPTQSHFEALVASLDALPTAKEGSRLLSWPVATVVPFLVRPDVHMFLKPQATREAARKLGVELHYDSRPSWQCYERLLSWSQDMLHHLRQHGARDLIDVQSFIWTIGRPER